MSERPHRLTRDDYRWSTPITTRWADNDVYGHVNNVVYYAWFDSVVNRYLIEKGQLDILNSPVIGLCVESSCSYAAPLAYPDGVAGMLRVAHLGNSSVKYELGIFKDGEHEAAAQGSFTHVFVGRTSRRPEPIPSHIREALEVLRAR
jgi:acyl-CoA thioester hydrolase